MIDPTSDVGDVDPEDAPSCATCGETVVEAPNHRVVTWIEDDAVEHRHFCTDDCRTAWSGER
jgi:endogenous inhibitor of DNA gyrase (YacG/DUF329 family)